MSRTRDRWRSWIARSSDSVVMAPRRTHPMLKSMLLTHSLEWISRFHVVVVHFPIALLLTAALAEAMVMWRGATELVSVARFCVRLGAAGAIGAAALGWTRGSYSGDASAILAFHRWIGTAACICSI